THYDGQATWEQRLGPSSGHGVTSVVMGNCGVGFAPCRPEQRDLLVKVMEGVEDVPEVVMTAGLPWNWETFPDYLDALQARTFDVDVAAQLPHSALRVYVMGERAATGEPPTADDLAQMRALTAQAIGAGALGVTTSRNLMHRTKAGQLAPSLHSEEDELGALADGLRDAGRGVFQLIPAPMGDAQSEFALMRRLAQRSGQPLSYTLIQMPTGDELAWRKSLDALSAAAAEGLSIRAQVAPRPVGMFYGLDLSFHPFAYHPSYKAIAHLPLAERVARLRTPGFREHLLAEQPEDTNPVNLKTVKSFQYSYVWRDEANYEPVLSDRIDHLAKAAGRSVEDFTYDLLLADDSHALFYQPGANYRDGNL
ncbi:MAG: amidohydrolase, partial [Burkholderiales bacterium PBB5]